MDINKRIKMRVSVRERQHRNATWHWWKIHVSDLLASSSMIDRIDWGSTYINFIFLDEHDYKPASSNHKKIGDFYNAFIAVNAVDAWRIRTIHLSLLASLSDSRRVRMSPSRTGPLTFLIIDRLESSRKSTLTWVHCPWEPVRPNSFVTLAKVILSIFSYYLKVIFYVD